MDAKNTNIAITVAVALGDDGMNSIYMISYKHSE